MPPLVTSRYPLKCLLIFPHEVWWTLNSEEQRGKNPDPARIKTHVNARVQRLVCYQLECSTMTTDDTLDYYKIYPGLEARYQEPLVLPIYIDFIT